jgi:proton-translocating NADH-quinone oxidoreductase chain N
MNVPMFVWLSVLPLVASPLSYLVGRWADRASIRLPISQWLAMLTLVLTWLPLVWAARELNASYMLGAIALRFDGVSLLLGVVVLSLGTLVTLYSGSYMRDEVSVEKYYALLVAMSGMMMGLGCAGDLFNLWVWFEALAVSSYLLVAFYREQPASLEAGVKYLAQSATGSVLVLMGIALVFAQTGTLDLARIATPTPTLPPPTEEGAILQAAAALFIIGFGVKAALAPLHTWLPDAHAQAPSGISAMLSGIVIAAGLIAMLRATSPLASLLVGEKNLGTLLMIFSAVNMLVGNLLALRQTQVKRLLAFSSLSHVGYMLLGLGIGFYTQRPDGLQGGFFHLLNHGLMKGLAFLAAGALLYALRDAQDLPGFRNLTGLSVADLAGAARRYPIVALTLSIALLGLGGLPPLAGFMSKWQIFVAGFATQNRLVETLVIFATLNSILSLAYYMPIVNALYRQQPSAMVLHGRRIPITMSAPLVVLTAAIIVIGVLPNVVTGLSDAAGMALINAMQIEALP